MKTVDLIPFILLELNEQDQYGLELTKAIETKTNGLVVIKQPTLYTVLKKLEKSKFITSYWQDSEIGGKRHYYKLTEFGKIQVSTLPTFNELLLNISEEDSEEQESIIEQEPAISNPVETIVPSEEVFSDNMSINPIDTATETEINYKNVEILKDENLKKEETFAENNNVSKFTELHKVSNNISITELQNNRESTNILPIIDEDNYPIISSNQNIKFVEYKNIKKDEQFIASNKLANKLTLKSVISSVAMLVILMLCEILTKFSGISAVYYIFWISALVIAIFHPIITALQLEKIKEKYKQNKLKFNYKKSVFINLSVILLVLVALLIANVGIGNNTFIKIFSFNNFENLYAPILLSCIGFIDTLIKFLLFRKNNK